MLLPRFTNAHVPTCSAQTERCAPPPVFNTDLPGTPGRKGVGAGRREGGFAFNTARTRRVVSVTATEARLRPDKRHGVLRRTPLSKRPLTPGTGWRAPAAPPVPGAGGAAPPPPRSSPEGRGGRSPWPSASSSPSRFPSRGALASPLVPRTAPAAAGGGPAVAAGSTGEQAEAGRRARRFLNAFLLPLRSPPVRPPARAATGQGALTGGGRRRSVCGKGGGGRGAGARMPARPPAPRDARCRGRPAGSKRERRALGWARAGTGWAGSRASQGAAPGGPLRPSVRPSLRPARRIKPWRYLRGGQSGAGGSSRAPPPGSWPTRQLPVAAFLSAFPPPKCRGNGGSWGHEGPRGAAPQRRRRAHGIAGDGGERRAGVTAVWRGERGSLHVESEASQGARRHRRAPGGAVLSAREEAAARPPWIAASSGPS